MEKELYSQRLEEGFENLIPLYHVRTDTCIAILFREKDKFLYFVDIVGNDEISCFKLGRLVSRFSKRKNIKGEIYSILQDDGFKNLFPLYHAKKGTYLAIMFCEKTKQLLAIDLMENKEIACFEIVNFSSQFPKGDGSVRSDIYVYNPKDDPGHICTKTGALFPSTVNHPS